MMKQTAPHSEGAAPYSEGSAPYSEGSAPYAEGSAPYSEGSQIQSSCKMLNWKEYNLVKYVHTVYYSTILQYDQEVNL